MHERLEDEAPLRVIDDVLDLAIPKMERAMGRGVQLYQSSPNRSNSLRSACSRSHLRTAG